MDKEFVTYRQALLLKELGFNEDTFGGYDFEDKQLYIGYENEYGRTWNLDFYIHAPLKQQVFRWFREKYGLQAYLTTFLEMCRNDGDTYHVVVGGSWYPQLDSIDYEKAENAAIDKLIERAKQQISNLTKWIKEEADKMIIEHMIERAKQQDNGKI
jgi:hypothetical protein